MNYFFVGGLVVMLTRYLSLPPGSLISYLPVLNQQSPKHTNGVAVFCLVVAAAFGVEWLRRSDRRIAGGAVAAVLLGLIGSLGYLVWRRGGLSTVDPELAALSLGVTGALIAILLAACWQAYRAPTATAAATILTAAAVGECSAYLLLGTADPRVLVVRVGIGALVTLAGILVARQSLRAGTVAGLVALAAYVGVVVLPSSGLPERVAVDTPPRYMLWLREAAGHEYRSFGIYPDYSSVGEIQDVEVVGPLATNPWVSFVDLVSSPTIAKFHRVGSTFSLDNKIEPTFWYDLTADYPRARPLLDWMGVRYLVLDKTAFDGRRRSDHLPLLDPSSGLRVVYDDAAVTILESPTAQSKAFFTTRVQELSAATTLAGLQADPRAIQGAVTVESEIGDRVRVGGDGQPIPVLLREYRPNDLRARFEAPAPGLFVVKDSYFPGWQATINGQPAEVIKVNGLVRGVVVPTAGPTEVTMTYRPASFNGGVALAGAVGLLLLVVAGSALAGRVRRRPIDAIRRAPIGS